MHKVILSYSCAASYSLIRSVIMTMWNDYSAAEEGIVRLGSDISGRQTVSMMCFCCWLSPIIHLLKTSLTFVSLVLFDPSSSNPPECVTCRCVGECVCVCVCVCVCE